MSLYEIVLQSCQEFFGCPFAYCRQKIADYVPNTEEFENGFKLSISMCDAGTLIPGGYGPDGQTQYSCSNCHQYIADGDDIYIYLEGAYYCKTVSDLKSFNFK